MYTLRLHAGETSVIYNAGANLDLGTELWAQVKTLNSSQEGSTESSRARVTVIMPNSHHSHLLVLVRHLNPADWV